MPTFIEFLLQFRIGNCQRKDMILVFHCCVISYLKPSNFRQVTPDEWFETTPLYYLIFFCGSKVQACCKLGSLVKVSLQGSLFKVSVQLYFCLELRVNIQVHWLFVEFSSWWLQADVSVFLWDINQGTFSGPSYIAFSTIWQFALMRPAGISFQMLLITPQG